MLQTNYKPSSRTTKTKYRPLPLFQNGADLPLFTKSPDVARWPEPEPELGLRPSHVQLSLFDLGVTK